MIKGIRHEQVENRYHIGGWRWQLLETVKALHEIDDPCEEVYKLTLIHELQESKSDNDIVVAVKRYRYSVENYRNPELIAA